jgi:hypothetical protein
MQRLQPVFSTATHEHVYKLCIQTAQHILFGISTYNSQVSNDVLERREKNAGTLGGRAQQRTTTLYSLIKTLMINDNIYTPSLWKPLISNKRIYTEPQRYIHNPSLQFNDGVDCFSQKFVGCGYGYAGPAAVMQLFALIYTKKRSGAHHQSCCCCCCYMAAVRLCDVYTYISYRTRQVCLYI